MLWLWITLGIVGPLTAAVLVMIVLGKRLSSKHVVGASLHLARPPREVYELISDLEAWPTWCRNVQRVEKLPDRDGCPTVRMHMGRNRMVLKVTAADSPDHFAMTIDDEAQFFGGVWEYRLNAEVNGTRLRLTEHGEVKPALPRFLLRYVLDPAMYLRSHLRDVANRFGEPPQLSDVGRVS